MAALSVPVGHTTFGSLHTRARSRKIQTRNFQLKASPVQALRPFTSSLPSKCGRERLSLCNAGLRDKKCEPCEQEQQQEACDFMGFCSAIPPNQARQYLDDQELAGWDLVTGQEGILTLCKRMKTKNYTCALNLFKTIGEVAEAEGHHPDLHLEGWNQVTVNVSTHAIGGLSENDFILAAKINTLDIQSFLSKRQ
mmetsp:Transcript_9157/g.10577  ORF Transcript_9157/g.10577 Transcript_9157/m.10577 type:complete len:195 (-) Transcript_9157:62-646(-)